MATQTFIVALLSTVIEPARSNPKFVNKGGSCNISGRTAIFCHSNHLQSNIQQIQSFTITIRLALPW